MIERKYYSINEVSKMTGLSVSKLRYAERIIPGFNVHKIRSRRYYTKKNLDQICKSYGIELKNLEPLRKDSAPSLSANVNSTLPASSNADQANADHSRMLGKIDSLVAKLSGLSSET